MSGARAGDRAVAVDVAAVSIVAVAVCVAADRLALMSTLVPAVIVARLAAWRALPVRARGHGLGVELAFLSLCAALGGFNDWNTVVRHGVYAYTVPADHPELSTIPTWMLLYWGLILRAIATLARWSRLGARSPDRVRVVRRTLEGAPAKIAAQLALVLVTRQAIYRLWDRPIASWLPFALALAAYAWMFRPGAREARIAVAFLVIGPVVEALFIRVGGLHRYALGWFFGVPLWIVLWWVLAILIWSDLAPRIEASLGRRAAAAGG